MSHGKLKITAILCSCAFSLFGCGSAGTGQATAGTSAPAALDGAIPQCDELLSDARKDYRASAKTTCDSSRTMQEVQNNVGCQIQERIDQCESKKWGSGTGGLNLAPGKK